MTSTTATTFAPATGAQSDLHDQAGPALGDADFSLGSRFLDDLPEGVDQVPLLGAALVAAHAVDRAVAQLIECLLELDEHQLAEAITGVALEQWLAIVGRRTRSDRRMLLTTCDVLRRLPSLRTAFLIDGTISWAQTRAVALEVERLPRRLDDAIDDSLARTIRACQGSDPDVLTSAVSRALRSLEATSATERERPDAVEEFLAIQPRLDGSGGSLYGEFDALGLATIDAALTPPPEQLRDTGGFRGAAARGRARRLVEVCDASLAGGGQPVSSDAAESSVADGSSGTDGLPGHTPDGSTSRPQLLIRVELSSLLDGDTMPGELLTRLTGGRLWVDAETVRRLVEQRGADLRTVVLDDTGQIVGVGRRARVAPQWLRDAILSLHDTCSAPGCQRPARSCDIDHARPWQPPEPGVAPGRTDLDQLAPLCRTHNRTKEDAGWMVTQTADGSRTWHHPATGLSTTTRPATWQPPPDHAARHPDLARECRSFWDAGPTPLDRATPTPDAGPGPPARGEPVRDPGQASPARASPVWTTMPARWHRPPPHRPPPDLAPTGRAPPDRHHQAVLRASAPATGPQPRG